MDHLHTLSLAGGLFAVLVFIHFFTDWLFQSHAEAMIKHNHPWVRAKHCLIYTIGFIPIMLYLQFSLVSFLIGINVLFWSHFVEDSYVPVYLWAKYIRKPPQMFEPWKEAYVRVDGQTAFKVHPPDFKHGFEQFVETPIGKILLITVDQIFHLAFLWIIVYLAL